jgi:hypothetical protein
VRWYEACAEGVSDLLVEVLVVAVDAVGVGGEQDVDAVAGAGGDLGGFAAGVEPEGEGGVAQVVGPSGEGSGGEFGAEGAGAGVVPGAAVDRFAEYPAAGAGGRAARLRRCRGGAGGGGGW